MPLMLEPNFEFAAKNVEEFFAFMGVRFTAAAARFDTEEVRLHDGVAPGEKLHAHFGIAFEDFAFGGTDESGGIAVGVEKRGEVGFVEARDAAQRGDGGTHLAAFQSAEEPDGDTSSAGDLRERKAAFKA